MCQRRLRVGHVREPLHLRRARRPRGRGPRVSVLWGDGDARRDRAMSGSDGGLDGDGGLRDIGESVIEGVLERVGRGVSKVQERRPLAYDLLESEEAYLAVFDAAGTTNSDIQVQFDDDAVKVKIDRFREFHEEFEMRFPGRGVSLDGTAELPEDASVDPTDAEATLAENGTLRVRIPKDDDDGPVDVAEESRRRRPRVDRTRRPRRRGCRRPRRRGGRRRRPRVDRTRRSRGCRRGRDDRRARQRGCPRRSRDRGARRRRQRRRELTTT